MCSAETNGTTNEARDLGEVRRFRTADKAYWVLGFSGVRVILKPSKVVQRVGIKT